MSPSSSPSPSWWPLSPSPSPSSGSGAGGSGSGGGHLPPENKKARKAITETRELVAMALQADYAGPLHLRRITADYLAGVTAAIGLAEEALKGFMQKKVGRKRATLSEKEAKVALMKWMAEIQQAARQDLLDTDPVHLQLYRIGDKLAQSRDKLETDSKDLIDQAEEDDLSGFTAAKIEAARLARTDYINSQGPQTLATGSAKGKRALLTQRLEALRRARRKIKLAADAEWPHTNPANAEARVAFKLSPHRRYRG